MQDLDFVKSGSISRKIIHFGVFFAALTCLFFASLHNYLFFHSLIEIVTISVAFSMVIIIWNSRRYLTNLCLAFIATGYAAAGIIDLLYLLSLIGDKGLMVGLVSDQSSQFWICARYLQAITLLLAPFVSEKTIRLNMIFTAFASLTSLMISSVFLGVFPACYVEGKGFTDFRILSEYSIIIIMLVSLCGFIKNRSELDTKVSVYLVMSITSTFLSEILLTASINFSGFANMTGQYFNLIAFYYICRAIVVTGIKEPYSFIFRELKRTEGNLRAANEEMEERVSQRTIDLETLNLKLKMEVNERKRTEYDLYKNRRMLAYILNSIPQAIFWKNSDGVFLGCNMNYARAVGVEDPEKIVGKTNADLLQPHEDTLIYLADDSEVIETRKIKANIIQPFQLSDGTRLWVSVTKIPLIDTSGLVYGILGVFEDVTGRMVAEEKLRMYREHLEEQVLQRTSELSSARDAAESASLMKSRFLANMSHEIRTPLNAVIGMANLTLDTDLTVTQKDYLEKIRLAGESLLGVINDILDFSKIEAGKLEMEKTRFRLSDVLDSMTVIVGMKAREKKLEFIMKVDPEVPEMLVGDPMRLGQVLTNLCNNAVKFTEKGSITVSVGCRYEGCQGAQAELVFSVLDTGIGMSEEQSRKLFEPFMQVDSSTTRLFGGTGLGLAICRQLVELMDGEIWFNTSPGLGSEFFFSAVFGVDAEYVDNLAMPQDPSRMGGKTILIIDDSDVALDSFNGLLTSLGCDVLTAHSAEEGLLVYEEASKKSFVDLVIVDWKMPGRDGLEAVRLIKGSDLFNLKTRIFLTSASEFDGHLKKITDSEGLDGFLQKPISVQALFMAMTDRLPEKPLQDARVPWKIKIKDPDISLKGNRILLVEDNRLNREVASGFLTKWGILVTPAENGSEALEKLENQVFDAVLMDIQMPVMDGYEAAAQIRRQPKFADLPVIAMTANAMVSDREKCINAGMNDYVTKPVDRYELFSVLEKWLNKVGMTEGKNLSVMNCSQDDDVPLPPHLPGISITTGLKMLVGDRILYRELLCMFLEAYRETGYEIEKGLASGDLESAGRLAHSLKSVAATIGATELARISGDLETAIDKRLFDSVDGLMGLFNLNLGIVMDGLKAEFRISDDDLEDAGVEPLLAS